MDTNKPRMVEMDLCSDDAILAVVAEYEQQHPGLDGWRMPPKEFSDRLMKKMLASARLINGGTG